MKISLLVNEDIGIFDSSAFVLWLAEISLKEVEDGFMFFGVHPVIFEESD